MMLDGKTLEKAAMEAPWTEASTSVQAAVDNSNSSPCGGHSA